jgi:hypothetical protein
MKFLIDCVSPDLLQLLKQLASVEELAGFQLGGGTSLALVYGHRRSIDIDLFSTRPFQPSAILDSMAAAQIIPDILNRTQGSLCLSVNTIKVDILRHSYPLLDVTDRVFHFPLLSQSDLASMKINAVTNRGSKKDFSDLLMLHQKGVTVETALDLFCRKYGKSGRFNAIRSLNWFEDTKDEPDPVYINGWDWSYVKNEMEKIGRNLVS